MSSDQMPHPGKTKFIKVPPSRAGKDIKCPGYARGGGMFKLRFDWYIKNAKALVFVVVVVKMAAFLDTGLDFQNFTKLARTALKIL